MSPSSKATTKFMKRTAAIAAVALLVVGGYAIAENNPDPTRHQVDQFKWLYPQWFNSQTYFLFIDAGTVAATTENVTTLNATTVKTTVVDAGNINVVGRVWTVLADAGAAYVANNLGVGGTGYLATTDAGAGYVANNFGVGKTGYVATLDAGAGYVANNLGVGGTAYVATLDAGALHVANDMTMGGKVPTLRADIIDAGAIYVQGYGPITRIIPFTSGAIDFGSVTITCADSGAITATGARVGDPCIVGMPETLTGGGTGLHHNFTCYVSAADNVKIRGCAAGTADDPGSVTFQGYVISQTL